jgi:hypothetical protein
MSRPVCSKFAHVSKKREGSVKTWQCCSPCIDMTLYDVVAGSLCLLRKRNCLDELEKPCQQTTRVRTCTSLHTLSLSYFRKSS